jgi:hypothetical protein
MDRLRKELADLAAKAVGAHAGERRRSSRKLAAELSKLSKDSKTLSKFSNALSKASSRLSQSNFSDAIDSLEKSGDDLESLAKLADEMNLLDQALDLVQLSKEELAELKACPQCGTPYCPDCGKPKCACKPGTKPGGT